MTIENDAYGKAEWKKCSVCGLIAGDMVGTPPRCMLATRCHAVKSGKPLGSPALLPPQSQELRTAFELDEVEKASVRKAVLDYQTREAEEKAEHAILATAILDAAQASAPGHSTGTLTKTLVCGRCGREFPETKPDEFTAHVALHGDPPF